jgi:hypothetical protein
MDNLLLAIHVLGLCIRLSFIIGYPNKYLHQVLYGIVRAVLAKLRLILLRTLIA